MFDSQQIAKTEQRYENRHSERAETEAAIEAGAVLDLDTPERLRLRLERKGMSPAQALEVMEGEAGQAPDIAALPAADTPVLNVLERIIGKSNLIEAGFLTEGAQALRSVCRVEIGEANGLVAGYGTGVMVSSRLLLTNNHVLESAETAAASRAEFDYETDDDGRLRRAVRFGLDPDAFFVTDPGLDYTLVAVDTVSADGQPLARYAWIPLIEEQGKVIKGEYVNIVQHPNGEPKQVALRENQVVDLMENFLHYKTDTAPGSSGAPVFNDEWELVALHHSGVPARNRDGAILAIDGGLWSEEMGEHRVKWVANEGARISRIVRHLRGQAIAPAQRRLSADVLKGQQPPSATEVADANREPERAGVVVATPPPGGIDQVVAGDTVTWTVPLQVNVRLGTPVLSVSVPSGPGSGSVAQPPAGDGTEPAPGDVAENRELGEILADLERNRRRPYYDEAADEADRDAYYTGLPRRRTGPAFFTALSELLRRTHEPQLRYAPSRHVYPWVDLQPNGMLRSIYTQEEYDPADFIREDFRIEQERAARLRERLGAERTMTATGAQEELDALEALLPYNCEHVVPQSWFEKREPMRGDLHHLFACESRCNSFRRNIPYFDFPEFDEAVRRGCGMAEGNQFEPSHGKGLAARATLYFLVRYPGEINRTGAEYEEDRLALLLRWHEQEPPTGYERHRNAAIFALSGNRNPLVDFPEWAGDIAFANGLG